MSESTVFLETYLREIGVHTPVSLIAFGAEQTTQDQTRTVQSKSGDQTGSTAAKPQHELVQPLINAATSDLKSLCLDASTCRLCGLADSRNQVVFGAGNAQADLVFIGESPRHDEDQQGEPFVGSAGKMLGHMLHALALNRDDVYIMNAIKCSTPNNRDPRPDEVQACALWLEQQLDILQPKVICLLGKVAAQTILKTDERLADLRGRWHDYRGIPVWVTYHPAYLMRSPSQKSKSWLDLRQLAERFRDLNLSA